MRQFIVYACPTGILAEQLSIYFSKSLERRGGHAAHQYTPHCALTSLFRDHVQTIPLYLQTLDRLHEQWVRSSSNPGITLSQWTLEEGCYGLELDAPWLRQMMVQFVCRAHSPTRSDILWLKTWLYLSPLDDVDANDVAASDVAVNQGAMLPSLAQGSIHQTPSAGWDLRFYERQSNHQWICHHSWPLQPYARAAKDRNLPARFLIAEQLATPSPITL